MSKRIGILTGGGDAPGLNAVIRAAVVKGIKEGYEMIGFKRGWAGVLEKDFQSLNLKQVEDIHREGGTILSTSRTNIYKSEDGPQKTEANLKALNIYALIAVGGEDTLTVASKLHKDGIFHNIVGVPKTIDNDVNATDYTFGFDTAVNIATEAIDRLHTTAKSHNRVMVVELMGRRAGWITLEAGIAGGAHVILIPEKPFDIDEVCDIINRRYASGKTYAIVAVSEGAEFSNIDRSLFRVVHENVRDDFGHIRLGSGVSVGEVLEKEIERRTGVETRSIQIGYLQRGGAPSAFDRVLGTRFGLMAIQMITEGKFGHMASLKGTEIVTVNLEEAVGEGKLKLVSKSRYEEIEIFFGL